MRSLAPARACLVLLVLAGCATPAEEDPVQIKITDLDTRVARIERVVANNSLLELSNQMGELRTELAAMRNDIDQLNHALDTSRKQQHDLYADIDQRLKVLEARSGVVRRGATSTRQTSEQRKQSASATRRARAERTSTQPRRSTAAAEPARLSSARFGACRP